MINKFLFIDLELLKKVIHEKNEIFETKSRSTTINTLFLKKEMQIYSGLKYKSVKIKKHFLGLKLGEFVRTRKLAKYSKKKKK